MIHPAQAPCGFWGVYQTSTAVRSRAPRGDRMRVRAASRATAAAHMPDPTETKNASLAPWSSMTCPARAEATVMPSPIPVVDQVRPSVSCAAGTRSSTRPKAAINVGEIVNWPRR